MISYWPYSLHLLLFGAFGKVLYGVQWENVKIVRAIQDEVHAMEEKVLTTVKHDYDFRLFVRRVVEIYARTGKKSNIIIVYPEMEHLVENQLCNFQLYHVLHRTSLLFFDEKLHQKYVKEKPLLNTGFIKFPESNNTLPIDQKLIVRRQVAGMFRLGITTEFSKTGIEFLISTPTHVWSDNILAKLVDDRWGPVGLVVFSHGARPTTPFQHNLDLDAFFVHAVQRPPITIWLENAFHRMAVQPFEANVAMAAECIGRTRHRLCMRWEPNVKFGRDSVSRPRRILPYLLAFPSTTKERELRDTGLWFLGQNNTCDPEHAEIVRDRLRLTHSMSNEQSVPPEFSPSMNNIAFPYRNQFVRDNFKFPFHFDLWRLK